MTKQPIPPRGPRNLKAGGFTNGLWRLEDRAKSARIRSLEKALREIEQGTIDHVAVKIARAALSKPNSKPQK